MSREPQAQMSIIKEIVDLGGTTRVINFNLPALQACGPSKVACKWAWPSSWGGIPIPSICESSSAVFIIRFWVADTASFIGSCSAWPWAGGWVMRFFSISYCLFPVVVFSNVWWWWPLRFLCCNSFPFFFSPSLKGLDLILPGLVPLWEDADKVLGDAAKDTWTFKSAQVSLCVWKGNLLFICLTNPLSFNGHGCF